MPKKIKPPKKKISGWIINFILFIIGMIVIWTFRYYGGDGSWVYPWPSWITIAWGLSVIAHACITWANYEDKGHSEFRRQTSN